MENNEFIAQQVSKLPQKAKEELLLFMEFLFSKYEVNTTEEKKTISKKRTGFGTLKGIQLSDDFDDELEDFKEYMPK